MIVDYDTLKSSVADWLAKANLTGVIPTFIQLAEARINRMLRHRKQQAMVTGAAVDSAIALPADLLQIEVLSIPAGLRGVKLNAYPPERLADPSQTAFPRGYVIVGDEARLIGGAPDSAYSLTYFSKVPSLSDQNPQNWLILDAPDAYLFGALAESAPYLKEDSRVLVWNGRFGEVMQQLQAESDKSRYSPTGRQRADIVVA